MVSLYSTIKMMHGPINIRFRRLQFQQFPPPYGKLLTHLSLITQVRSTYIKITFLLIRTDTEFYFGQYKFFSFNNKKLKSISFLF